MIGTSEPTSAVTFTPLLEGAPPLAGTSVMEIEDVLSPLATQVPLTGMFTKESARVGLPEQVEDAPYVRMLKTAGAEETCSVLTEMLPSLSHPTLTKPDVPAPAQKGLDVKRVAVKDCADAGQQE